MITGARSAAQSTGFVLAASKAGKAPKAKSAPTGSGKAGHKQCGKEPEITNADYNVRARREAYQKAHAKWKACIGK